MESGKHFCEIVTAAIVNDDTKPINEQVGSVPGKEKGAWPCKSSPAEEVSVWPSSLYNFLFKWKQ